MSDESFVDRWSKVIAETPCMGRIEVLEPEGIEVTLTHEHILGAVRFGAGRYRITKIDGPTPEPTF